MDDKTKSKMDWGITNLIRNSMPTGIGFNNIFDIVRGKKNEGSYYDVIGSKSTLSKILYRLREKGFIEKSESSRRYVATEEGEKYLKRSEIVDIILSSNALDSFFDFSAEKEKEKAEEISAAYMLATAKKGYGNHTIAILHERLSRTHPIWDIDVLNYAIEMGFLNEKDTEILKNAVKGSVSIEKLDAFQKKLKTVWEELFKGVERLTIVETVNPQLLLEQIERRLSRISGMSMMEGTKEGQA